MDRCILRSTCACNVHGARIIRGCVRSYAGINKWTWIQYQYSQKRLVNGSKEYYNYIAVLTSFIVNNSPLFYVDRYVRLRFMYFTFANHVFYLLFLTTIQLHTYIRISYIFELLIIRKIFIKLKMHIHILFVSTNFR